MESEGKSQSEEESPDGEDHRDIVQELRVVGKRSFVVLCDDPEVEARISGRETRGLPTFRVPEKLI